MSSVFSVLLLSGQVRPRIPKELAEADGVEVDIDGKSSRQVSIALDIRHRCTVGPGLICRNAKPYTLSHILVYVLVVTYRTAPNRGEWTGNGSRSYNMLHSGQVQARGEPLGVRLWQPARTFNI